MWGLNFGIDFKGGSIAEVNYQNSKPDISLVKTRIDQLNLGEYSVRSTGESGFIIRTKNLSEPERVSLLQNLSQNNTEQMEVKRFDSVGPILGKELQGKAVMSIILVILAILLFITFAFRKVSEPVQSWKYGFITIVALLHDVITPIGIFSILGHFKGFEIDSLFVTAVLVILGFSVHDTIVVFDRTRENLKLARENRSKETFDQIVGKSISQTFTRSINTSLTVVLTLLVLYFTGPSATQNFSLVLLVGVILGTYSSIFLGSPLLVTVEKWQNRNK